MILILIIIGCSCKKKKKAMIGALGREYHVGYTVTVIEFSRHTKSYYNPHCVPHPPHTQEFFRDPLK